MPLSPFDVPGVTVDVISAVRYLQLQAEFNHRW
jgi:hypothetical protein